VGEVDDKDDDGGIEDDDVAVAVSVARSGESECEVEVGVVASSFVTERDTERD
jgi:hypothetical protein